MTLSFCRTFMTLPNSLECGASYAPLFIPLRIRKAAIQSTFIAALQIDQISVHSRSFVVNFPYGTL